MECYVVDVTLFAVEIGAVYKPIRLLKAQADDHHHSVLNTQAGRQSTESRYEPLVPCH